MNLRNIISKNNLFIVIFYNILVKTVAVPHYIYGYSTWGPWSYWSKCSQHSPERVRVRACHTVKGFKCRGDAKETIACAHGHAGNHIGRQAQYDIYDYQVYDPWEEDRILAMAQLGIQQTPTNEGRLPFQRPVAWESNAKFPPSHSLPVYQPVEDYKEAQRPNTQKSKAGQKGRPDAFVVPAVGTLPPLPSQFVRNRKTFHPTPLSFHPQVPVIPADDDRVQQNSSNQGAHRRINSPLFHHYKPTPQQPQRIINVWRTEKNLALTTIKPVVNTLDYQFRPTTIAPVERRTQYPFQVFTEPESRDIDFFLDGAEPSWIKREPIIQDFGSEYFSSEADDKFSSGPQFQLLEQVTNENAFRIPDRAIVAARRPGPGINRTYVENYNAALLSKQRVVPHGPVDLVHQLVNAAPRPIDAAARPIDSAARPIDAAHQPIDAAPRPIDAAPGPIDAAHQAIDAAHQPIDAAHQPIDAAHQPIDAAHQPIDAAHQPIDAAPRQIEAASQPFVSLPTPPPIVELVPGAVGQLTPPPNFLSDVYPNRRFNISRTLTNGSKIRRDSTETLFQPLPAIQPWGASLYVKTIQSPVSPSSSDYNQDDIELQTLSPILNENDNYDVTKQTIAWPPGSGVFSTIGPPAFNPGPPSSNTKYTRQFTSPPAMVPLDFHALSPISHILDNVDPATAQAIETNYPKQLSTEVAQWTDWSVWSQCCRGHHTRTRHCIYSDALLTKGCQGLSYEVNKCSTNSEEQCGDPVEGAQSFRNGIAPETITTTFPTVDSDIYETSEEERGIPGLQKYISNHGNHGNPVLVPQLQYSILDIWKKAKEQLATLLLDNKQLLTSSQAEEFKEDNKNLLRTWVNNSRNYTSFH